mmetsp:Transcript_115306/g.182112  ORF Transcript_115306/g.182112 Transcript_115306/m.182112 type:complete len:629 (+) Transcript_115306:149-2035(+)
MTSSRGRDAYRAVYLAAPLKFSTTLHAFARKIPRHFIKPWEKDPQAAERHKWHNARMRKRGKWATVKGPLVPLAAEGFPEPALVGAGGLPALALRAQSENVQSADFWHQLAERTRSVRDLLSVADIADILDSLVSADARHTDLMTLLVRELLDDIEKMTIMEAAAVANAYAHFNCWSEPLFAALSSHVSLLLPLTIKHEGTLRTTEFRNLAVLLKAFSQLDYRCTELLRIVAPSLGQISENVEFTDAAQLLGAFASLAESSEIESIPDSFWETIASKVPGSRMATLCPALASLRRLQISLPALREALTESIVQGLQAESPPSHLYGIDPSFSLLSSSPLRLPSFAPAPVPRQLIDPEAILPVVAKEDDSVSQMSLENKEVVLEDWDGKAMVPPRDEFGIFAGEIQTEEETAAPLPKSRWYNPSSRNPFGVASGRGFSAFNTSSIVGRNRRGALLGEALHGLCGLWLQDMKKSLGPATNVLSLEVATSFSVTATEISLCEMAGPLLQTALQGVVAQHLASCAEVYAILFVITRSSLHAEMVSDIVRESTRKLSNFSASDIRRVYDAAIATGLDDPYLERARFRRFPKTLRNALRDEPARAHPPSSLPPPSMTTSVDSSSDEKASDSVRA